jgi:flagellar biosynthesis protein FliQ
MSDATSADSPAPARNTTGTAGIITMIVGVVIAFLPLIIASISTTPGHNMWNESDSSSGAAAIWLLLITIPVGGITAIVGLVITIISAARSGKN